MIDDNAVTYPTLKIKTVNTNENHIVYKITNKLKNEGIDG